MDAASVATGDSREIFLSDGVTTEATVVSRQRGAVIFGHGLDPTKLNHLTDEYGMLLNNACSETGVSFVAYTTRGHGVSKGWQSKDISQFLWKNLSHDMNSVAHTVYDQLKYVVSGHSMGSATALFAAMQEPESVNGVILVRPPTAWATRRDRKQELLNAAMRNKEKYAETENSSMYRVLEGAAHADLPPIDDVVAYSKIKCPVLILAYRGDVVHPIATTEQLKALIPQAEVHIMDDEVEAKAQWGVIMAQFLSKVYDNDNA